LGSLRTPVTPLFGSGSSVPVRNMLPSSSVSTWSTPGRVASGSS
jgi:hypothetical protein